MSETIKYAGDYNLEICSIVSYQKDGKDKNNAKRLDIKGIVHLLHIYESLTSH